MGTPSTNARVLGLARRYPERRGLIQAPPDVRELVAALVYTPDEIDRAFRLLARLRPLTPGDLCEHCIQKFEAEGLIERNPEPQLTIKGWLLSRLLGRYSNSRASEWSYQPRRQHRHTVEQHKPSLKHASRVRISRSRRRRQA